MVENLSKNAVQSKFPVGVHALEVFEGRKIGDLGVCLHCLRVYPVGWFRPEGELQFCPFDGCGGDTVLDLIPWDQVRENHPEYPEKPEIGDRYQI